MGAKRTAIAIIGLALLSAGCMGGGVEGPPGFGDDEDGGPRAPREQLFLSPAGQPFRSPPGQPYPVAAWFTQADRDRDGKLTRAEFRADAEAFFKTLDANGDGQLDMPEATRWEEQLVPEIARLALAGGGMIGGDGRGRPQRRNEHNTRWQGAAAFSLVNEPHPIRGADADFSMSVSPREWTAAADRRFGLLDLDGDGVLALADLKPTPSQFRAGVSRRR